MCFLSVQITDTRQGRMRYGLSWGQAPGHWTGLGQELSFAGFLGNRPSPALGAN